jgi:hypothetical protein
MDTAESITFTSKLTFWDKFKYFYLLDFYSHIFLMRFQKKWQKILIYLLFGSIWLFELNFLINYSYLGISSIIPALLVVSVVIWEPMLAAFIIAIKSPAVFQLILTPGNATKTAKVRYSDTRIDRFKNAILFDTNDFYIFICRINAADKKVRLAYNIISKKQNSSTLAKFNFVKTISPDLKKIIKLHI